MRLGRSIAQTYAWLVLDSTGSARTACDWCPAQSMFHADSFGEHSPGWLWRELRRDIRRFGSLVAAYTVKVVCCLAKPKQQTFSDERNEHESLGPRTLLH